MTQERKHTPLPWEIRDEGSGYIGPVITSKKQPKTGPISGVSIDFRDERAVANTEFIVRAVNSHYELVEALEAYHKHFGPLEDNEMLHPSARRCMKLAEAALAKARGDQS